jgi:alanine dehydrogenase
MMIGVPKEVKDHESRVGVTPAGVKALVEAGHTVLVETNAGALSAFPDDEYQAAGAEIVGSAYDVWRLADMVVKVKEPVEKEYKHFREGLVLFTYLHLAPLKELTDALLEKKVVGIAYETVRDRMGTLPLLTPMSEVAGRMSVQVGATYLEKEHGGRGVLLGGVPGTPPGNVCIIGGGIVGTNAAKIALGMGARVTIVDVSLNRLRELDDIFGGRLHTLMSNSYNVARAVCEADLVIGGVLIPGAAAPKIVTKAMVSKMKKGAVIVDVADDGQIARSRHQVSVGQLTDLTLDVTGLGYTHVVRAAIDQALRGQSGLVRLTLTGEISPGVDLTPMSLTPPPTGDLAVLIRRGRLRTPQALDDVAAEQTVRGEFLRRARLADLDADVRAQVIATGLRALAGERDLEVD